MNGSKTLTVNPHSFNKLAQNQNVPEWMSTEHSTGVSLSSITDN